MKYEIKIKKGEQTLSLPKERVLSLLSECSEAELKLLLALSAESDEEQARELCALDSAEFSSALAFWRGAGVVGRARKKQDLPAKEVGNSAQKQPDETALPDVAPDTAPDTAPDIDTSELPDYTSADIKRLKGGDRLFNSILDEAQQTYGKFFNNVESGYIVAMRDHLGLDGEYILMLLEYFRREGKPLRYVAGVADTLVKRGICDPEALEAYLKRRDTFRGSEGKYRDLFGIGTRALTAYEEKYFCEWSEDMKMPFELVREAFERTVEKKGTPQKSYINGILNKWYEAGVKSVEQLSSYEEGKGSQQKNNAQTVQGATGESTFDIDDFFSAALDRMYGGASDPEKEKEV